MADRILRFGHDFRMLSSGTDVDGLCAVIEHGVSYVKAVASAAEFNKCFYVLDSAAGVISHVPWSFPILKLLPGADKDMKTMHNMGQACVDRRMQAGSSVKDLFYYLVSLPFSLVFAPLIAPQTEDEVINSANAQSGAGDGVLGRQTALQDYLIVTQSASQLSSRVRTLLLRPWPICYTSFSNTATVMSGYARK